MIERALVCGLGSIGRRHASVLRALGVASVHAYRRGRGNLGDDTGLVDETWTDLDLALEQSPDVVVVCNPTSLHLETATRAVSAGAHCLVEKPASTTADGLRELAQRASGAGVVVSVAHNLRYHPLMLAARASIYGQQLGRPLLLRAHFGTYLPHWHPWEDYRSSYAARRDLGGGAVLTHIHEPDLAYWLLGPIEQSHRLTMGFNPLGTDVDEVAAVQFRHANGALASLTLSLAERPPSRTLYVACDEGTIEASMTDGTIRVRGQDGLLLDETYDPVATLDASYANQMQAFLQAAADDSPPPVPLEEAAAVLDAVSGVSVPASGSEPFPPFARSAGAV